jgi:DTW domain-containing protein YfiP
VVLLQHPRERGVAIGTARMASLCLVNSELHVGVSFDAEPAILRALRRPDAPAVLLYPGPTATPLEQLRPDGPRTLVVVDGTWSQARKLVRVNRLLHELPRVSLTPATPSEYRIRPEPRPDYVSTIEALYLALRLLEGDEARLEPLLAPFRAMVQMQLDHEQRRGAKTDRHAARRLLLAGKPVRLPRLLAAPDASLVCAAAEANAWTREHRATRPDELVHWLAVRVSTGESFERLVAPRHPLAPGTSRHLGLTEERLLGGASLPAFLAEWRRWSRPDDVLCTWGRFTGDMLEAAGGELPARRLDLRQVVGDWLAAHPPAMAEFLRARGVTAAPRGAGRGGERLGQLVEVARFLRARALAATDVPGAPLSAAGTLG